MASLSSVGWAKSSVLQPRAFVATGIGVKRAKDRVSLGRGNLRPWSTDKGYRSFGRGMVLLILREAANSLPSRQRDDSSPAGIPGGRGGYGVGLLACQRRHWIVKPMSVLQSVST